jgi:hypothetical protein
MQKIKHQIQAVESTSMKLAPSLTPKSEVEEGKEDDTQEKRMTNAKLAQKTKTSKRYQEINKKLADGTDWGHD